MAIINIDFITIALEAHTSHHGDTILRVCRDKAVQPLWCHSAVVIDEGDEFPAAAAQAHIAGMAQTSGALVADHPQTDRSRLIIAEEPLSPIAGGVIDYHHLEVRIIQLLDGRQGIGFQSVLPVLGANDDRYEWRHVLDELDDLNDYKRSANAGPAGRYRPVGVLTGAEIVSRNSPAPYPAPQVWARLDDEWPPDGTGEVLDR